MTYTDVHRQVVPDVPPEQAWAVVERLGGDPRFYAPRELWRLRGLLDRVVGGPGFRLTGPGRPLQPGDEMDFWTVEEVSSPSLLSLRARTRMPGTAHVELRVRAHGAGSEVSIRNLFEPAGLAGEAYWWSQLAAHAAVFELMTRRLAALVQEAAGEELG